MHALQPKHTRLKPNEVKEILKKFNISIAQLPKIKKADLALLQDAKAGEVFKVERKTAEGKVFYYRLVVE